MLQTNDPNPNLFVSASSQNLCHLPGLPCYHLSCPCRRPCPLVACRFCPQGLARKTLLRTRTTPANGWRRRRSRASSCKASLRDSSRIWYHKGHRDLEHNSSSAKLALRNKKGVTWSDYVVPLNSIWILVFSRLSLKVPSFSCNALRFLYFYLFLSAFVDFCKFIFVLDRSLPSLRLWSSFQWFSALIPSISLFQLMPLKGTDDQKKTSAAEPKLIGWRMRAVDNDALPVWIPTFLVGTVLTPGKYFARPCFDTLYAYWTSTWRYLKQLSPLLVHMRLLFSLSLLWDTSLGI